VDIKMATSHRLAWCAGLFDGEGCIQIAMRDTNLVVILQLAMTHPESVCTFAEILCWETPKTYKERKPAYKPITVARTARRELVKATLESLLPYLITRRERAIAALEVLYGREEELKENRNKVQKSSYRRGKHWVSSEKRYDDWASFLHREK